jgi:Cu(I)-responsive transcriptional regulator
VNIGAAEQASGLPAKTIRYYEDIGLLVPARQQNGYREYGRTDVHKLAFLKRARGLGFSIEDCRALMSLYEDRNRASADVKALAHTHIHQIEAKIADLEGLQGALAHLIKACHGDARPNCPILDDLADLLKDQA